MTPRPNGSNRPLTACKRPLRLLAVLLGCLVLLGLVAPLAASFAAPARAQERPRTVLDMLFGGGREQRPPPGARPLYRVDPNQARQSRQPAPQRRQARPAPSRSSSSSRNSSSSRSAPSRSKAATGSTSTAARSSGSAAKPRSQEASASSAGSSTAQDEATDTTETAETPPEKTESAEKILVVGDFMAAGLADGLTELYADNPNIVVDDRINGSSGLVRDDFYDWPQEIGGILESEKPAVLVVMIGSNDRQTMRIGSTTATLRSDSWTQAYEDRIGEIVTAAKEHDTPLVWVGMPPFKSGRMSEDMVYLNDLFRKGTGGDASAYVDIWDGFVDADDNFVFSGPGVNGQDTRLRNADGITMTDAGQDKAAFFAEKAINRFVDDTGLAVASVSLSGEQLPNLQLPAIGNSASAMTAPPVSLDDPSFDGSETLLGKSEVKGFSLEPSPRDRLVVNGNGTGNVPGRADDFAWNRKTNGVNPQGPEITYQGSVDLNQLRRSEGIKPPEEMPGILDAIMEEWTRENKADAGAQGDK